MFGFGKKQEDRKAVSGCCGAAVPSDPGAEGGCVVKILGSGCKNCHALYENTRSAVAEMGKGDAIAVEYVTDMSVVMNYGVMSLPALVCCEKVISAGKVLRPAEVRRLLEGAGC